MDEQASSLSSVCWLLTLSICFWLYAKPINVSCSVSCEEVSVCLFVLSQCCGISKIMTFSSECAINKAKNLLANIGITHKTL